MRLALVAILIAAAMLVGCEPKQYRTVYPQSEYAGPMPPPYEQPSELTDSDVRDSSQPEFVEPLPSQYQTPRDDSTAVAHSLGITTAEERRRQLEEIEGRGGVSAQPATGTAPIVAPRTGGMIEHTVVRGDTLWGLAQKYLGAGRRWTEIQAANPGIDPSKLMPGQRLLIPAN